jgi:diguanylate cyclase (GGDEF)-like protein
MDNNKQDGRAGVGTDAADALPSAMSRAAGHDSARHVPMSAIVRIAIYAVTAALFIGSALQGFAGNRDLAILFALAAPLGISAWGFARAGHNEAAIALLCTVLTTVVTLVLMVNPLGAHDVAISAYAGIVLCGALLLSRRAYYALAGLVLLAASAAFIADILGLTRSQIRALSTWSQFVEFIMILGVFAVLGRYTAETLFSSLGIAHRASTDDSLTGFANRNGFFFGAAARLKSMTAGAQGVLVICDIEGFRRVNVVIGHRAADNVLVEVARRIKEANGGQFAGRIGDDEFAILAPVIDENSALAYARKIHDALQFEFAGVSVRTCTGFASFPRDAHGLESLLLAAEDSLTNARQDKQRFASPADRT